MSDVLNVQTRELFGKRNSRRLRRAGQVPAVLYGHGEGTVSLTLNTKELEHAIRHGAKLIELRGSAKGNALLQNMQWNTFETEVLHIDLIRVSADERLVVEVTVETRGTAPGISEGGQLKQLLHEIEIETLATAIPERLHLNVNELKLGESLCAKDIEDLPAGAKLMIDPETPLVHCIEVVEEEEVEGADGPIEPEVIGGRKDDEEGEND
jgi:large subunit ribosomal protein L25